MVYQAKTIWPFAMVFSAACLGLESHLRGEPERVLAPWAAQLEPDQLVAYKRSGNRELFLHIFEPPGNSAAERRPAFLIFHGGGWVSGKPRDFYPFAARFSRWGMVGISVEYRLRDPETATTVFDCVQDGRSAVRFVRRHAKQLRIDPNRIVVGGGSAGAHLAAGTALFDGIDEEGEFPADSCRPDLLVLYYPVIDTSAGGYGQQKIGDRWQELSPLHRVQAGLPPTVLFHGTADTVTPYSGAVAFHQEMRSSGVRCELLTQPGGRHGYLIFDLSLFEREMSRTRAFLTAEKVIQ